MSDKTAAELLDELVRMKNEQNTQEAIRSAGDLSEQLDMVLDSLPVNSTIRDNAIKCFKFINADDTKKILCSISGGADSDCMMDLVSKCDISGKVTYVWFNTGIEYEATKEQLKYLEETYGVEIVKAKPKKTVPKAVRDHGQPFMSKQMSVYLHRLQLHDFDFARGDRSFEELYAEYPNCKSVLMWWCSLYESSKFNLNHNSWMREFLIEHPPWFHISERCCTYAKKGTASQLMKTGGYDLDVFGVRKLEGGARSNAYKSCYNENSSYGFAEYLPLFWWSDQDRWEYEQACAIKHSRCYTEYGMTRTGCAGCPCGRNMWDELAIVEKYEPKLYKALWNIFGDSYRYTQMYDQFCKEKNAVWGTYTNYLRSKEEHDAKDNSNL